MVVAAVELIHNPELRPRQNRPHPLLWNARLTLLSLPAPPASFSPSSTPSLTRRWRLRRTQRQRFNPRRSLCPPRQRQDDKWEHDLYKNDEPQISNRRVEGHDLRLKLQKKGLQPSSQGAKGTFFGVQDLREKLSSVISYQPISNNTAKPKLAPEATKPTRRIVVEASMPETKKAVNLAPNKKQKSKMVVETRSSKNCQIY